MTKYHTGVVGAPCDTPEIYTKEDNTRKMVTKMAKEYIEKKMLLNDNIFLAGGFVEDEYAEGYMKALDDIEEVIRKIPAANVRKNIKAHWYDIGSLSCRCSACGCKNNRETIFCPSCGAQMTGNIENE